MPNILNTARSLGRRSRHTRPLNGFGLRTAGPMLAMCLLALTVSAGLQLHSPPTADAAELTGAITDVRVREATTPYWGNFNIDLDWAVPNSAASGDTFYFDLPPEINSSIPDFELRDPDDLVVANATRSGSRVTFTLTDYANTHSAVSGTAFFQAIWEHSVVTGGGPVEVTFTTSTQSFSGIVEVGAPLVIDRTIPRKYGYWTNSADQGITTPAGALRWGIDSSVGPHNSVRIVDTPGAGHTLDCDSLDLRWIVGFNSLGEGTTFTPMAPSSYSVNSCTTTLLDLTVESVPADQAVALSFSGTVTDVTVSDYNNSARVNEDGAERAFDAGTVRSIGGGTGGGNTPRVSVGDYVFVDNNRDGVQDEGDIGIKDVTLTLTGPSGDPVMDIAGNLVGPATTDADGKYSFDNLPVLPAGQSYTVTIDSDSPVLAGYTPTKTDEGTPATDSSTGTAVSGDLTGDGDSDTTLDFGFVVPRVSVGDYVFVDNNRDGVQDEGDIGIKDVTLTLTGPSGDPVMDIAGNLVGPATTDADGKYSFDNLPVLPAGQSYTVTIDSDSPVLAGYTPTKTDEGTPATDSSTGTAVSGDLTGDGDSDTTLDFGFVVPRVSVGDYVFVDNNRDGVQDEGDIGIKDVTLTLTGPSGDPVMDIAGNLVGPATTDADGKYSFDNLPVLPAGQSYTVTIDSDSPVLAGYTPTKTDEGTPATDSSTGTAVSGDLTGDGDSDTTLDFGFVTRTAPSTTVTPSGPSTTAPATTPTSAPSSTTAPGSPSTTSPSGAESGMESVPTTGVIAPVPPSGIDVPPSDSVDQGTPSGTGQTTASSDKNGHANPSTPPGQLAQTGTTHSPAKSPLAKTGSDLMWLVVAASVLLGAGFAIKRKGRRAR